MASDGVPEEYLDVLFQEFAYDPIRLPHAEDPAQLLYNRRTLETIWVTKHEADNPYTRQPFNIKNVIPQTELREEMHRYIAKNRIPGLQLIPDYTKVLNESEMRCLLKDLVYHYRYISQKNEKKEEVDWKTLWRKLNLIRLYCEYEESNRDSFSSIEGYKYLFMVVDTELQYSYSSSDEAKEVCREVARIVDIVGLKHMDLLKIPENSLQAFIHILSHLGQSEYLKIQSIVLKIYCRIFYYNIDDPLLNEGGAILPCVIQIALELLGRENSRDEIIDEDLHNGMAILQAAWIGKSLTLLYFRNYVDVLVNVIILCISRYRERGAACIGEALDLGFGLIEAVLKAEDSEVYSYGYEKMRLVQLDVVEHIVGMVELALAGFEFKPSHIRSGLIITAEFLQTGRRKMRTKEIEVFADFLRHDTAMKYGTNVGQLLQDIISMATSRNSPVH